MLSNCGIEDSWESIGQQGDQTSQSYRKSTLNIHWKDWWWSWSSNTLATWCEEPTHCKTPWCWGRLKSGGEGDNKEWDGWMASLGMSLSKLWEMTKDRKARHAAVRGVTKSWTQLNDWPILSYVTYKVQKQKLEPTWSNARVWAFNADGQPYAIDCWARGARLSFSHPRIASICLSFLP